MRELSKNGGKSTEISIKLLKSPFGLIRAQRSDNFILSYSTIDSTPSYAKTTKIIFVTSPYLRIVNRRVSFA